MNLTKRQRHDLYIKLLEHFNDNVKWFLDHDRIECNGICYSLNILTNTAIKIDDLPELMALRPMTITTNKVYWFGVYSQEGVDARIKTLEMCIEHTKPIADDTIS